MSGLANYDPPPHLRPVEAARQCRFLGANLTPDEVTTYHQKLLSGGIPCRQCNGQIPAYHCSHPARDGFTRIAGGCTACRLWEPTTPS